MKYTVEIIEGTTRWYKEGTDILHRENGPAIENINGDKFWCKEGKYHREGGPAIENINGDKFWCKEGKYHREGGPAIEHANGDKLWFLEGKEYTEEEYNKAMNKEKCSVAGKIVEIDGKKYILQEVK